jgi:tetratricopeptide (TPR) repeat protein
MAARVMLEMGDVDEALRHTNTVLEMPASPALVTAQAHLLLGDCLASAATPDYRQALDHHLQAIKLAEPLAVDEVVGIRRPAKDLMLDAHLAAALDIGWGKWRQKPRTVNQWIDRAKGFADEIVAHEQGDPELQLRVQEGALCALAGAADPPDPTRWVEATLKQGSALLSKIEDPARRQQIEWQMGQALASAVDIARIRKMHEQTLRWGTPAIQTLADGDAVGKQLPLHDYVLGRLHYQMGSVYAVSHNDYEKGIAEFNQAVPLLESPVPPSSRATPGRQGEAFVSMAVSYWETNHREEALRLTKQGLKLMEHAVDEGHMSKAALAVPYGNLSSMHSELGDTQKAKHFADMAKVCLDGAQK